MFQPMFEQLVNCIYKYADDRWAVHAITYFHYNFILGFCIEIEQNNQSAMYCLTMVVGRMGRSLSHMQIIVSHLGIIASHVCRYKHTGTRMKNYCMNKDMVNLGGCCYFLNVPKYEHS